MIVRASEFCEAMMISSISFVEAPSQGSEATFYEFYLDMGYCSNNELGANFEDNYIGGSKQEYLREPAMQPSMPWTQRSTSILPSSLIRPMEILSLMFPGRMEKMNSTHTTSQRHIIPVYQGAFMTPKVTFTRICPTFSLRDSGLWSRRHLPESRALSCNQYVLKSSVAILVRIELFYLYSV